MPNSGTTKATSRLRNCSGHCRTFLLMDWRDLQAQIGFLQAGWDYNVAVIPNCSGLCTAFRLMDWWVLQARIGFCHHIDMSVTGLKFTMITSTLHRCQAILLYWSHCCITGICLTFNVHSVFIIIHLHKEILKSA